MRITLATERLEVREVPVASLQLIHNSAFTGASPVDIYINNALAIDNLMYSQATPFFDVVTTSKVRIDITAGDALNNATPLSTSIIQFANAKSYAGIIIGNPMVSTGDQALQIAFTDRARQQSTSPNTIEALAFNGLPDRSTIDFKDRNLGTIANDVPFGGFGADYVSTLPGLVKIDVKSNDGILNLGSFANTLGADAKGKSLIYASTGFADPLTATNPGVGLLVIYGDGSTQLLNETLPVGQNVYAASGIGKSTAFGPDNVGILSVTPFATSTTAARPALGDITGDGFLDGIVGAPPGNSSTVFIYNGIDGKQVDAFNAYEDSFLGGIFVQTADVNQDGVDDIVTSPDQGGGSRIRIFDGRNRTNVLADFFGIDDPTFFGGSRISFGDVNGDDRLDLLVGAGFGGGPRVAIYDGRFLLTTRLKVVDDFFVFEQTLRNGVFLTAADFNNDGFADLAFGGGPGGGPRVQILSGQEFVASKAATRVDLANFFAGDSASRTGVRLTAKDVDGDALADIVITSGDDDGAVRTYLGKSLTASGTPPIQTTTNPFGTTRGGLFVG